MSASYKPASSKRNAEMRVSPGCIILHRWCTVYWREVRTGRKDILR